MRKLIVMRIHVAPDREPEFEAFVAERALKHQNAPGFDRMYLLRERQAEEFRLVTWWRDLPDPESWVRKETYALSENPQHAGIIVGPVPFEVLEIVQQFEPTSVTARVGKA